ncbi:ATP-binding cassette sub-family C member 8-like [Saccoglossus kowalevskii]
MENGIVEFLMEEERTVIVVTHHLQYLCHADQVVIMEDCTVARQGDLKEIRRHSPELYSDWQKSITVITESEASQSEGEDVNTERKHLLDVVKQMSNQSVDGIQEDGLLIVKEERETGSVSLHMYLSYARAIKYPFVFLICILYITQTALHIVNNFWLSEWSEAGVNIDNKTEAQLEEELDYYLNGYAALSFGFAGFNLLTVAIIIICSLFAIRRMYIRLLRNIVHAPMRFFDTTPLGRILNRFSTDTQVIDQRLWKTTVQIIQASLPCISAIVVSAVVTPIFIGAVAPVIILYYFVQSYFLSSARELQRLDSITRSPIFEHFSETVGGLSTVRAFRHEAKFRQSFMHRMNKNNLAQLYLNYSHRWLGVNLEILGALVILISGLSSLISCELGQIEPSLVGLALTYSVSISGFLTWLVRAGADCEMYMNAVERVEYYSQVNTEQYQGVYNPPPDWPDKGDVILENVSVRYATGLDPVLRDVNVRFKAGEKVGICGRTGSGKSSLTLALYRIIDTFQGRILIDGVDISHVPLLTLRSRLAIIPQDPVLFQGTIRFNLDPEGSKTDDELWQALEIAQLKPVVSELHMTLDAQVTEEGENFSLGQRQLFCLARAFLRKARILVMDEATASIDIKTDKILQQVVANAFADMTVLTIAHRIATILDADSVLVLSDGSVEEYDTPSNLLANSDSAFVSLVNGPS